MRSGNAEKREKEPGVDMWREYLSRDCMGTYDSQASSDRACVEKVCSAEWKARMRTTTNVDRTAEPAALWKYGTQRAAKWTATLLPISPESIRLKERKKNGVKQLKEKKEDDVRVFVPG